MSSCVTTVHVYQRISRPLSSPDQSGSVCQASGARHSKRGGFTALLYFLEWRLGPSIVLRRLGLYGVGVYRGVMLRLNHHLGSGRSCSHIRWPQGRRLHLLFLGLCRISVAVYLSRLACELPVPWLHCTLAIIDTAEMSTSRKGRFTICHCGFDVTRHNCIDSDI